MYDEDANTISEQIFTHLNIDLWIIICWLMGKTFDLSWVDYVCFITNSFASSNYRSFSSLKSKWSFNKYNYFETFRSHLSTKAIFETNFRDVSINTSVIKPTQMNAKFALQIIQIYWLKIWTETDNRLPPLNAIWMCIIVHALCPW